jgi:hypothetical protein
MAVQYSVTLRNNRLDQIESTTGTAARLLIYSGAVPANCAAADPAGLLATLVLPSDWMNAASGGQKTLLGSWTVAASGTGTAQSFRIKDSGLTTCHMQGTCATGGGDLSLDNASITAGQTVTVTAFTLTDGNA